MNNTYQQTTSNGDTAFRFEQGDDWMRFSADLGRLCQEIGDQVRRTVEQIDVESILGEVRRAADDIAAEVREAAENWRQSRSWGGPTRVQVEIRADAPAQSGGQHQAEGLAGERKLILDLLAAGKISAEEAARLLDALGS